MSAFVVVLISIAVLVGAVMLILAGVRATRTADQEDPLMARLAEATQRGDVVLSLEQIEMQQPFTERVMLPFLQKVGELSSRFTPQKAISQNLPSTGATLCLLISCVVTIYMTGRFLARNAFSNFC